jgi:uncharacterized protein (TIGR00661 family)
MTQAMVISDLLHKHGMEVVAVVIGASGRRTPPDYFLDAFSCPVYRVQSPNFVADKEQKAIKMGATVLENLKKLPRFIRSLQQLDHWVQVHRPDCILNFYDMLGGIYAMCYPFRATYLAIGHQYLMFHPDFTFAKPGGLQKVLFKLNTAITCANASKIIALSLWKPQRAMKNENHLVWPPLIRERVRRAEPSTGDFFLVYIVNSGYAEEIYRLAKNRPQITIEAFWDAQQVPAPYLTLPNLTFHRIDDERFVEKLRQCKAYLSTAGFESIAEAMFLGKKTLMVPVKGQYEQRCNACDAEQAGAGRTADRFAAEMLEKLLEEEKNCTASATAFSDWQQSLDAAFLAFLTSIPSPIGKRILID